MKEVWGDSYGYKETREDCEGWGGCVSPPSLIPGTWGMVSRV